VGRAEGHNELGVNFLDGFQDQLIGRRVAKSRM
jgi:hypothetical protein